MVLGTDKRHNILEFGIQGKCLPLHMPSWTSNLSKLKDHNLQCIKHMSGVIDMLISQTHPRVLGISTISGTS